MQKLNFKYAGAWNFLPFGPEGFELNFANYGNIVLIQGENRDAKSIDENGSESAAPSSNGSGKCFKKSTPILMFDGSLKEVQNVRIGDKVMGPDSKPRTVLDCGSGEEMLYEIRPKKGNSYFVNESHVLTLKPLFRKYNSKNLPAQVGEILNISVANYLKLPKWVQNLYGTYRTGVDFPCQKLVIDPYILGVWLGDGTTSKPEITTADRPVLDAFLEEAKNRSLKSSIVICEKTKACKVSINSFRFTSENTSSKISNEARELAKNLPDKFISVKISKILSQKYCRNIRPSTVRRWLRSPHGLPNENSFLNDLRELGFNGKNKFVPEIYKINSRENRLQILAGLLDTDGCLSGKCGFEFSNKNKQLAEDCAYLARSLGFAANIAKCRKECCNNGKWGTYYRVSIYGDCQEIPVRIIRKKASVRSIHKDHLKSAIEIIPLQKDQYFGFTVNKDHLFLLGDFTVVHNSSCLDLIVWTLYGKTVKRPEKISIDDVIHNKIGKNCKTILRFDNYQVMRTRSGTKSGSNTLRLWESDQGIWDDSTEITQGTMALTQKKIIDITGFSYDSFINICIFTDDQRSCFLECSEPTKLEIVESLMSLGTYREWYENAKVLLKEVNEKIKIKSKEYSLLLGNKDDAVKRLDLTKKKQKDWKIQKEQEQIALKNKINFKTQELGKTDNGAALVLYQKAQEKIVDVNEKIEKLEKGKVEFTNRIKLVKEKESIFKSDAQKVADIFNQHSREAKSFLEDRKKKEAEIYSLKKEEVGTQCGKCKSVIAAENIESYIVELNNQISDINLKINEAVSAGKEVAVKVEEIKANQTKLKQLETQTEQKIKDLEKELQTCRQELTAASQVREPKADSSEFLLQQQIEELKNQLLDKEKEASGNSPFDEILDNDEKELSSITLSVEGKELEIKDLESDIPFFNYWISGFGPNGIRKWVIDGIIPDLNSRINYWLQFLIDGTIILKFDNQLKETIERNPPDGDPYIYYAMSTGQRRRLNLAVGHAFAYITELSAESTPSIIFLDEITTNVDASGVRGIYKMIYELAEDKQVFVTTHDENLVNMLNGCDVINLVHENGFTKFK